LFSKGWRSVTVWEEVAAGLEARNEIVFLACLAECLMS
jgi:hypothetical protein